MKTCNIAATPVTISLFTLSIVIKEYIYYVKQKTTTHNTCSRIIKLMYIWCVIISDDQNTRRKPIRTSISLDASLPVPFSENKSIISSVCTSSLESVFLSSTTVAAYERTDNAIDVNDASANIVSYQVPGIGPSVSDVQMQKVLIYFKKCAADNGGYVYEFDIENDQCPQLDAINNY